MRDDDDDQGVWALPAVWIAFRFAFTGTSRGPLFDGDSFLTL